MQEVAILYICTGKYSRLWNDFYKSCEKKFLLNSEKHYFVFTDSEEILAKRSASIHPYHQDAEPWPFPTLKRFEYFLKAKDELLKFDFIIFMNGTLLVKKRVYEEDILPEGDEKLFVTLHPGFFDKTNQGFTYDRNPECSAYIPENTGDCYFAGGFNGGRADAFIRLAETLSERVNRDLEKGIIALWHDESHLNRYMLDFKEAYRILSPAYLTPEQFNNSWNLPFECKIMVLEKRNHGGLDFFRSVSK